MKDWLWYLWDIDRFEIVVVDQCAEPFDCCHLRWKVLESCAKECYQCVEMLSWFWFSFSELHMRVSHQQLADQLTSFFPSLLFFHSHTI